MQTIQVFFSYDNSLYLLLKKLLIYNYNKNKTWYNKFINTYLRLKIDTTPHIFNNFREVLIEGSRLNLILKYVYFKLVQKGKEKSN